MPSISSQTPSLRGLPRGPAAPAGASRERALPGIVDTVEIGRTGPVSSRDLQGFIIPQDAGRIRHVVMKMGADPIDRVGHVYERLMTLLPDARFTFVMQEDDGGYSENRDYLKLVRRLSDEGRIDRDRVKIHTIGGDLETWFQDSSIVRGSEILSPDRLVGRATYQGVLRRIIAEVHPGFTAGKQLPIFLEGGNQRATRERVFVGSDVVRKTRDLAKGWGNTATYGAAAPDERIMLELGREFPHQRFVVLGDVAEDQKVFHIDMGFVPLGKSDPESGKPLAVVGDTLRTVEILRRLKQERPQEFAREAESVRQASGCTGGLVDALRDLKPEVGQALDAVARQLEGEGYCVRRVPYIGFTGNPKPSVPGGKGDPDFPWFAYCNGLVDGDTYIMPSFGLDALDDEAERVFRSCGYDVERIPMSYLSRKAGALNCMTLVIEREY